MGLMYLAFKKYIHRDIAARNVLISSEGVCKVSQLITYLCMYGALLHANVLGADNASLTNLIFCFDTSP